MTSKNLKIIDRANNEQMTEFSKDKFIKFMSLLDEQCFYSDDVYDCYKYSVYVNDKCIGEIEEGHVIDYTTGRITTFKQLKEMVEWGDM